MTTGLALPDDQVIPSEPLQLPVINPIATHVAFDLPLPEGTVRRRDGGPVASPVASVPIAAVDENHPLVSRKYKVGVPREVFPMNPESVTHTVYERSDVNLRFRILRSDLPHDFGPLCL